MKKLLFGRILGNVLLFIFVLGLSYLITQKPFAAASSDSVWVNNSVPLEINLEEDEDVITNYGNNVYKGCYESPYEIQKYQQSIAGKWVHKRKTTGSACATQTSLGTVYTRNGPFIQLPGTDYAQRLVDKSFKAINFVPIPGQGILLANLGERYFFITEISGESVINRRGERVFQLSSLPQEIQDEHGNSLGVVNIAFSKNGEWLVMSLEKVLMRFHVPTRARQTFSKSYISGGARHYLGVSNDGRYVYSQTIQDFRGGYPYIYDLIACEPSESMAIEGEVVAGCERSNYHSIFRQMINGFEMLGNIHFSFDNQEITALVRLWGPTDKFIPRGISLVTIRHAGYEPPESEYIALGDSFSSGEGDTQGGEWYEPGTDTPDNRCHISRRSYPYSVALQAGLHIGVNNSPKNNSLFHSVACSGAVSTDITDVSSGYNSDAQAAGLEEDVFDDAIYNKYLPGYRAQLKFIERYKPSAATISIIGNDIGFSDKIKRCLAPDTCFRSYEERLAIMNEVKSKFTTLTSIYSQLKGASPHSKVYAVGYPQIASTQNYCGVNVLLDEAERKLSQGLVSYLNATIKAAADYAGVVYINTENAFTNRLLCDGPQEILAVNGLTAGNDIGIVKKVIGNESYHPNPLGHTLMAEEVAKQSDSLTRPMPEPNRSLAAPSPFADEFAEFLDAPRDGGPIRNLIYEAGVAADIVVRKNPVSKTVLGYYKGLYDLWLNSDPVYLGSFEADDEGSLNLSFTIPENVPIGFHTLHLYGKSMADEDIDIYKTIYVAASEEDYDGDGIPNKLDSCDAFENSGADSDSDGIDDICDSFINDPPDELVGDTPGNDEINPKPPVNNPETVAGDEDVDDNVAPPPVAVASNTSQQSLHNFALSRPLESNIPVNDGNTEEANISSPQVAAAVKSEGGEVSPGDNRQATPETTASKYNFYIIALAMFLSLPLLFLILRKTHKHPLSN